MTRSTTIAHVGRGVGLNHFGEGLAMLPPQNPQLPGTWETGLAFANGRRTA
jgi:hypothetical protein